MTSFAGWDYLGGLTWMLKDQGANVLLNLFFGPVINAARAVALQVSSAVTGFLYSFLSAVFPQITKYYASGNLKEMHILATRALKMSFLLVFFLSFPIMININFILSIWLKTVPNMSNIFLILVFIDILFQCILGNPLTTMIFATGNIRKFQIYNSATIGMIIPFSYVLLKIGFDSTIVFYMIILFNALSGLVKLYYANKLVQYSYKEFILQVVVPIAKILIVTLPLPILLRIFVLNKNNFINCLSLCMFIIIEIIPSFWFWGFERNEKNVILKLIKDKCFQK